jgi:hypothetical protein
VVDGDNESAGELGVAEGADAAFDSRLAREEPHLADELVHLERRVGRDEHSVVVAQGALEAGVEVEGPHERLKVFLWDVVELPLRRGDGAADRREGVLLPDGGGAIHGRRRQLAGGGAQGGDLPLEEGALGELVDARRRPVAAVHRRPVAAVHRRRGFSRERDARKYIGPRRFSKGMRVRTISVLFIVTAIYFIMAVAAEVFIDDFIRPQSLFAYLLVSTLITGVAALAVDIDVPD